MPKRNKKLYRYVNSELETYTFVDEGYWDNCKVYLTKDSNGCVCPIFGPVFTSVKEAKRYEIAHLQQEIRGIVKEQLKLKAYKDDMMQQITRMEKI
jgi:hypothetical protein